MRCSVRCHVPAGRPDGTACRPSSRAPAGELYPLYRPELEKLQAEDPPLSWVMGHRRSIREYGARPLSARQLGEFLYRVARIQDEHDVVIETPRGPMPMTIAAGPIRPGALSTSWSFMPRSPPATASTPVCIITSPAIMASFASAKRRLSSSGLLRDAADSAGMPERHGPGALDTGGAGPADLVEVRLDRLRAHPETRRRGLSKHVPGGDRHGPCAMCPRLRRLRRVCPGRRHGLLRRDFRGRILAGEPTRGRRAASKRSSERPVPESDASRTRHRIAEPGLPNEFLERLTTNSKCNAIRMSSS